MGFPLMVRAIRLSIEAVDRRLEEAAGNARRAAPSGCSLTVTLPLILPGIIAGMLLCFAKALGEFGATITFVSNIPGETQTLPPAIYTFTQVPGGDAQALRLTLVAVVDLAGRRCSPPNAGRAARRAPGRRGMTLEVDVDHRLGDFRARRRVRRRRPG